VPSVHDYLIDPEEPRNKRGPGYELVYRYADVPGLLAYFLPLGTLRMNS
jgi:hypothetical protein